LDPNDKMASSGRHGYAYSYSYEGNAECDHGYGGGQTQVSADENDDSFIVKLHCPGLTSMKWIVKLYSLVLGGLGVILSFTWICFHLYVLGVTSLAELRQHRYLDITLGVILLVSMLCLLYGTYSQSPYFLILFFILSLVVVIGYWTWYIYVNFVSTDPVVFEDQIGRIGLVLTLVYCLLLVPIMLLYRYMELQMTDGIMTTSSNGSGGGGGRLDARKFPPRYEESFEYR